MGTVPGWRRRTAGEHRLPVAVTVLAAIALQLLLPDRLGLQPKYLLPGLELTLLIALVVANPRRIDHRSRPLRLGGLTLIALVILANGFSAVLLITDLLAKPRPGEVRRRPAVQRRRHLLDQHYRLRLAVLGGGPRWTGGPRPRRHPPSGSAVPANDQPKPCPLALGAKDRRLPVPEPDQRHRFQPHRHHANDPESQTADGRPIIHRPNHHRTRHRPRRQHPPVTRNPRSEPLTDL